ncbi:MAG: hypothetical protein RLZZ01_434 [Actinomycetota bacterium]|jgi:AcrR family transcriptional regulator
MDAIRSSAIELLLATTPEHLTIREIAEHADVAHVCIPQYFGGKADLFADIFATVASEAAQAFTWPAKPAAGIRPELLRLARLALWLSANHPDGVPDGPRPLASRLKAFLVERYRLDDRTAALIVERLIGLVLVFAGAPTAVSRAPIDLAAHIELEFRILEALSRDAQRD